MRMTKQGGWPPSGFGDRLRRLREQQGLTQRQLAERAGCHLMTVAKLEAGTQEPAWPLVQALARALGVTCLAFAVEEEAGAPQPAKRGRGGPPKPPVAAAPHPAEDATTHAVPKPERGRK